LFDFLFVDANVRAKGVAANEQGIKEVFEKGD
jgi:hypothetical protein